MRTLGPSAQQWNAFAKHLPDARSKIERDLNRILVRDLIGRLDATEYRVLHFIVGRTLGWQKFAEAIPMSHFLRGMVDADGYLALDEHNQPYCRGVGIRKDETVRSAVRRLETKGYVTVWEGRPGTSQPANVYMPFQEGYLARSLIASGSGVLPNCAPMVAGEHIVAREAVWQVTDTSKGDDRWGCIRVSTREKEAAILPLVECARIPVKVWQTYAEDLKRIPEALIARSPCYGEQVSL